MKQERVTEIPQEFKKECDAQRVFNMGRMLNDMGASFDIVYNGIQYTNRIKKDKE